MQARGLLRSAGAAVVRGLEMVRGQFTTCLHYMGKLVEGVGGVPDAGCRNGESLAGRLRASSFPAGWITKRSLRAGSFGGRVRVG